MFASEVIPFNYSFTKTAVSPYSSTLTLRPAQAVDADLIVQMHQQLPVEPQFQRYHRTGVPSRDQFRQMCALDGKNGRTFLALSSGRKSPLIGVGTYVTNLDIPIIAEVSLLVTEPYQGQGIGRKLMNRLVEDAQKQNIRFFEGYFRSSNIAMIHLLHSSGKLVESHIEYGRVEMRVELMAKQPQPTLLS